MAHLLAVELERAQRNIKSQEEKLARLYRDKSQDTPYVQNLMRKQLRKVAEAERAVIRIRAKLLTAKMKEEKSANNIERYREAIEQVKAELNNYRVKHGTELTGESIDTGEFIEVLYLVRQLNKLEDALIRLLKRQSEKRAQGIETDSIEEINRPINLKTPYDLVADLKAEEEKLEAAKEAVRKKIFDSANTEGSLDLLR
jgi:hypothetical protein